MEIEKEYEKNVRPELGKMLRLLKLNKAFERAEGDRLFYKDGEKEKFVWDFLGGYGTTILGHNHPRLAQVLMHLIESRTPFAAQASVRPQTVFLAAKLNELIKKHTGEDRHFYLTCTNSGAEAVEAALKHALFSTRDCTPDEARRITTILDRATADILGRPQPDHQGHD